MALSVLALDQLARQATRSKYVLGRESLGLSLPKERGCSVFEDEDDDEDEKKLSRRLS
jgi:hypothetical protein